MYQNERVTRREKWHGRAFNAKAFGNSPTEIELDALDQARAYFGPDIRLQVRSDFTAAAPLLAAALPERMRDGAIHKPSTDDHARAVPVKEVA